MPRYQKQIRIATSRPLSHTLICALLALVFLAAPADSRAQASQPQSQSGQPPAATLYPLYLVPLGSTSATLETHTISFAIDEGDGGKVGVDVVADYRVKNSGATPTELTLRLTDRDAGSLSSDAAASVTLRVDGAALPLVVGEDGVISAVTTLPADSRQVLSLRYRYELSDPLLATLRYSPLLIRAWPGAISLSVQMMPSPEIAVDSQLQIAPSEWSFEPVEGTTDAQIRWLYDGRVPDETFIFQFIAPATWRELNTLEQAIADGAESGADLGAYRDLGDLYRRLSGAASNQSSPASERFYAQALAAYTAGLAVAQQAGSASADRAAFHVGLAQLYRDRVSSAAEAGNSYARLLSDEAAAALALLPADAALRGELEQWQAEGLRMRLQEARDARDWPVAIDLLDKLALLPAAVADPAVLADQRQDVLVQQALQLLELDQREAAMAVAGAQLTSQELLPPSNARSLFESWDVTMTLDLDRIRIELVGATFADRHSAAVDEAGALVDSWRSALTSDERRIYQIEMEEQAPVSEGNGAVKLGVEFASNKTGLPLARPLSAQADWALLRSLLLEVNPQQSASRGLFWQEVTLSQPLDLATVGEQWKAMAANLSRQADLYELQGASVNPADAAASKAALAARVKAVNYRAAAHEWQTLMRDSTVLTTLSALGSLSALGGQEADGRTWLTTVSTPSQVLELQAQSVNGLRLVLVGLFLLAVLFLLAGLLWRLM